MIFRREIANEGVDALEFYAEALYEVLEQGNSSKKEVWALFDVLAEKEYRDKENQLELENVF